MLRFGSDVVGILVYRIPERKAAWSAGNGPMRALPMKARNAFQVGRATVGAAPSAVGGAPARPRRCVSTSAAVGRALRAAKLPIVLLHDKDSCEFGLFFTSTPQDLISDGLYKTVALELLLAPA